MITLSVFFFSFKVIEVMAGLLCSPLSWCFCVLKLWTACYGLKLEAMWSHCRGQSLLGDDVRQDSQL